MITATDAREHTRRLKTFKRYGALSTEKTPDEIEAEAIIGKIEHEILLAGAVGEKKTEYDALVSNDNVIKTICTTLDRHGFKVNYVQDYQAKPIRVCFFIGWK